MKFIIQIHHLSYKIADIVFNMSDNPHDFSIIIFLALNISAYSSSAEITSVGFLAMNY